MIEDPNRGSRAPPQLGEFTHASVEMLDRRKMVQGKDRRDEIDGVIDIIFKRRHVSSSKPHSISEAFGSKHFLSDGNHSGGKIESNEFQICATPGEMSEETAGAATKVDNSRILCR
jgi:hypothetical protein